MKNPKLMQLLKCRGMSVSKLARAIGTDHRTVSLTLNPTPGRGHQTRPKLAKLLTAEELGLLGWDGNGAIVQTVSGQLVNNNNQVEQSSTGNNGGDAGREGAARDTRGACAPQTEGKL